MITPRFECSQTDESVVVKVYCPSATDIGIDVDNDVVLTTVINPYFLRLVLPAPIVGDGNPSSVYDPGSGYLTITLSKLTKGQHFKDLDLLSKLLAPRPPAFTQPLIEVVDLEQDEEKRPKGTSTILPENDLTRAAENEWHLPQDISDPPSELHLRATRPYGFLDMHLGYLLHVSQTDNEVNELGSNAETLPVQDRRNLRLTHENDKWDEEHYMADYADDEQMQELLTWVHPHIANTKDVIYTDEEKLTMIQLPRKEYLASPLQNRCIYQTLISLLFTYAYDSRTTQHDPTPESAWTMSVLTPAFSALDPPPYDPAFTLSSVFTAVYRRVLAFPLYRSFVLAEACRADVSAILLKGKRTVLRCLLEMKRILDHHEVYYIYNKIWVDDMCVWLQGYTTDEDMLFWGTQVECLHMNKSMIGWGLQSLEDVISQMHQGRQSDSDDE